ncbi:MAG: response regulator transcription factor [Bacteroidales bacterium]|nr:response regulator transcription factor [Bacteroidales bacterium]
MTPKILLVDDDVRSSTLLRRFLESEGFKVDYAVNGVEGLSLYAACHPDLVLLDINMPLMNGFEVAQRIRENDRRTVIFFLTDRTEKVDRLKGFALKGNDYIPKPFYPEELVAKINERFDSLLPHSETEYKLGDTVFRPNLSQITFRNETHSLSVRQSEILQLLAENKGMLVERETILNHVWGDNSYANSLALNVQITYLRRLIDDPAISILSIKKRGYILQCAP